MKWIIVDWMSKRVFDGIDFDSFEEARDFISEYADSEAYKEYPDEDDEEKREEVYNGICEDLYAEEMEPVEV